MKHTPARLKQLTFISLLINVVFIIVIVISYVGQAQISDISAYKGITNKLCEQDFQKNLNAFDNQYADDSEKADRAKLVYATTICLKNYKTGQPLDITPLTDQIK